MNILRQALVIARRDFISIVATPTFLLFLLAPLMLGYFLAHQFGETATATVRALAGTPLLGYVAGLFWGRETAPF